MGRLHNLVVEAAREAGCTPAQIVSTQRTPVITQARMRAMSRAYSEGFTTSQIGRVFKRDHTTVMHAVKKYTQEVRNG